MPLCRQYRPIPWGHASTLTMCVGHLHTRQLIKIPSAACWRKRF
jgi:hypothetical protein